LTATTQHQVAFKGLESLFSIEMDVAQRMKGDRKEGRPSIIQFKRNLKKADIDKRNMKRWKESPNQLIQRVGHKSGLPLILLLCIEEFNAYGKDV